MNRTHRTDHKKLTFENRSQQLKSIKPNGLWYEIDHSWIKWCDLEMPEWSSQYQIKYRIELNENKILFLTDETIQDFHNHYGRNSYMYFIDWLAVARDYAGIEITNYNLNLKYGLLSSYYDYWDCASGCIWHKDGLKLIELIGGNNE